VVQLSMPTSNGPVALDVPDDWQLTFLPIAAAPPLTQGEMRQALQRPIGTRGIRELARGKSKVVILVDDTSRPTPAHAFVPLIIEELEAAGVRDGGIKIVGGTGCHRPMEGPDFRLKLGDDIVDRYECVTHNPFENTVYIGTTSRGTRVELNVEVAGAELRIAAGGIIPHHGAGFGGGAKLILPGVCSIATIEAMHRLNPSGGFCKIEGNGLRAEIEEAARMAGLDMIVNCVLNARREVAGLYAGDLVAAHRAGVQKAFELYSVAAPAEADVAIVGGFPKDREFYQSFGGLICSRTVRPGGTIFILAAGSDGAGLHYLEERERLAAQRRPPAPLRDPDGARNQHLLVWCPGVGPKEAARSLPPGASFHRDLGAAMAELRARHHCAKVNVFPQGSLTILRNARNEAEGS